MAKDLLERAERYALGNFWQDERKERREETKQEQLDNFRKEDRQSFPESTFPTTQDLKH